MQDIFIKDYLDITNNGLIEKTQTENQSHQRVYIDSIVQKHVTIIYDTIYNAVSVDYLVNKNRLAQKTHSPHSSNKLNTSIFSISNFNTKISLNSADRYAQNINDLSLSNRRAPKAFSDYLNQTKWADDKNVGSLKNTNTSISMLGVVDNVPSFCTNLKK